MRVHTKSKPLSAKGTVRTDRLRRLSKQTLGSAILVAGLFAFSGEARSGEPVKADVAKTSGCGCCVAWIDHLEEHGFSVSSRNLAMGQLMQFKVANGITPKHAFCHTAKIGGYTIEGHVPASDIRRMLTERPDAVGLAVPEMPIGSPGMEMGSERDAFDVLLLFKNGSSSVYASYPAIR